MVAVLDEVLIADLDELNGWEPFAQPTGGGDADPAVFGVAVEGAKAAVKILATARGGAAANLVNSDGLSSAMLGLNGRFYYL